MPKKTIPKAEYTGPADGLYMAVYKKDVNKLNELIDAGIGIRGTRYKVRGKYKLQLIQVLIYYTVPRV